MFVLRQVEQALKPLKQRNPSHPEVGTKENIFRNQNCPQVLLAQLKKNCRNC
jgi:hypothetical protein